MAVEVDLMVMAALAIKLVLAGAPQEELRPRVKLQENKRLSQGQKRTSVSLQAVLAIL